MSVGESSCSSIAKVAQDAGCSGEVEQVLLLLEVYCMRVGDSSSDGQGSRFPGAVIHLCAGWSRCPSAQPARSREYVEAEPFTVPRHAVL